LAGRPPASTLGTRSTRSKTRCWTCGEPHYYRDFRVERARSSESTGHTTVGDLGKAHKIHVVVNNCQAEHQSTVLKMSGTMADQTFSILIDPGGTKRFISSAMTKNN
jgi:hypothetical protein